VRERTAQLETANKELEAFSYSVSHDLKAPLRAISGFAQIIARRYRGTLNEEASHYFGNILTASERMGILINELLKYSRIVGRNAVLLQPVPLEHVFTQVLDILSEPIKTAGAELSMPEDLPAVNGDMGLLRQVFTNIIDNAITFRSKDVTLRIEISARDEDGYVVIRIATMVSASPRVS
jgi:light-regulated signal transduction histidine kinase (bacteriophytochrome)